MDTAQVGGVVMDTAQVGWIVRLSWILLRLVGSHGYCSGWWVVGLSWILLRLVG